MTQSCWKCPLLQGENSVTTDYKCYSLNGSDKMHTQACTILVLPVQTTYTANEYEEMTADGSVVLYYSYQEFRLRVHEN